MVLRLGSWISACEEDESTVCGGAWSTVQGKELEYRICKGTKHCTWKGMGSIVESSMNA